MAISYIYTGQPMTGTVNDDFFIAYKGSTGTDDNTINAGDGDDWVIADSSDTWIPNASYQNDSIGDAFNLETLTSSWTTAENPLFGDSTIPHTTAIVETTIGQSEFFRVAVGAGQTITIDIDYGSNTATGTPRDLVVEFQDSMGNIIVTGDDSLVADGGLGSFSSSPGSSSSPDPYLTYTIANAGIYYINVRPFGGGPGSTFTENNTFVMNVSVTGHVVAATNPVGGEDTIDGGPGNDSLFGQGGDDVINGGRGDDFIHGGSGVDTIHGGNGSDTIYGGDDSEENVHGDGGDDILYSGGEGHYYGDGGNDVIYAGLTTSVNEILDGGAGTDTLDTTSWNGTYVIDLATGATNFGESFVNFENAVTGNGDDTITGTGGANIIRTGGGTDTVFGGGGNDVIAGGAGGDNLDGGSGVDTLDYSLSNGSVTVSLLTNSASGGHATGDTISNFESIIGSAFGDTLTGSEFANTLTGGLGADIMLGLAGDDTYYVDNVDDFVSEASGSGIDTVVSGSVGVDLRDADHFMGDIENVQLQGSAALEVIGNGLDNTIVGNSGANMLLGEGGRDYIAAGAGNDTIYGGVKGDFLFGNKGNDFIAPGAGADQIDGGLDFDRVWYGDSSGGVSIDLTTGTGSRNDAAGDTYVNTERVTGSAFSDSIVGNALANALKGGAGDDVVYGKDGRDVIEGQAGKDQLYGGGGNDNILGGDGNDKLYGNSGVDKLDGGTGNDQLTGGADADYFVFETNGSTGFGGDIVYDFQNGVDRLDMRGVYLTSDPGHAPIGFDDLTIGAWGDGVKIVVQNDQIVYLDHAATHVTMADIDAGDFLFA